MLIITEMDNTDFQNKRLGSSYDLFQQYGEFKAKARVQDGCPVYIEIVFHAVISRQNINAGGIIWNT